MSAWQDWVHEGFGRKQELDRLGPARRRMQREEWRRSMAASAERAALEAEAQETLTLVRARKRDVEKQCAKLAKWEQALRQYQVRLLQTPVAQLQSEVARLRKCVSELEMTKCVANA